MLLEVFLPEFLMSQSSNVDVSTQAGKISATAFAF